jgi:hypothetical protein
LAHLRVAYEPDDEDDDVVVIPALPTSPPQLLPLPSAWWETPAVTSRVLGTAPEDARSARFLVRDLLTRWGLASLVDDAELIVAELVANAVRHGLRPTSPVAAVVPAWGSAVSQPLLRLCLLRRVGEVMLAVTDPSDEPPVPQTPDASWECGRGLQIVGALSYIWGWSPIDGYGKAVWAILKYS